MNTPMRILITGLFCLVLSGLMASAAGADDLKARFKERLPAINALKAKGVVGENNKGFLEFRGAGGEGADVVGAENADRQALYQNIAASQGATPDLVGNRSAIKFRDLANPGDWLQDDGGKWYQK